jgi:hypothetical protein
MRHTRRLQRGVVLIGALLGLSGCQDYTPPVRWAYEEVDWRTVWVSTPVPATLSAFYEGMQRCGKWGIPDCGPIRPDGSAACDLYLRGPYGGRGMSALGRVTFAPRETGTTVTMGVGRNTG